MPTDSRTPVSPAGPTPESVTAANLRVYEAIASAYDRVDSRRGDGAGEGWLDAVLSRLRGRLEQEGLKAPYRFLDAGAGTGFLAGRAARSFERLCVLDVSPSMIEQVKVPGAEKFVGDCYAMPLPDASVDAVGAFATLHHLAQPERFFADARRVLKSGGVLYTDHDIEASFVRRFRAPLKLYRRFFDHGHAFHQAAPTLRHEDYELSEFHGDEGLDGRKLEAALKDLGFDVLECTAHWEGMGLPGKALSAFGLAQAASGLGRAPALRLLAVRR